MVFNKQNKGFFLTLDDEAAPADLSIPSRSEETPEPVAAPVVVTESVVNESSEISPEEPVVAPAAVISSAPVSESATQTTAEAIAAELAAADQARPAVTMATFAPDNLLPGTGLMARRRKPGASMSGFRSIASDLFKV